MEEAVLFGMMPSFSAFFVHGTLIQRNPPIEDRAMATPVEEDHVDTVADLLKRLGGISARRVVLDPPPGKATEKDLLRLLARRDCLFELVDGVLVEKVMGYQEGSLALWLGHLIQLFLDQHNLGNLAGSDATMRLMPRLVRLPDLSFVRWEKLPGRQLPAEPIPDLAPDLAIEVLSKGNTPGEMRRKVKEYCFAGTSLVWLVDPKKRIVTVHSSPDSSVVLTENDTLDGSEVLPGFALPVRRLFERLPAATEKPGRKRRKKS